ncbi:hypothetical protein KUV64_05435 [Mameliella alba]|uniref:hypothetical protein n=1 Tax=Mameliella alba TaxID=561184 RepID=UPI001C965F01|nr:hypothetical protein [Mameliella alba]MBY6118565.1 hypothetical protein [Mameliella alba]
MKAEDIKDRETLEAWLRERPRRDAVVIAHRAALRVLPLWGAAMGEDWARESGLTALPLLRCGLISAVVSVEASSRIASEAIAAAHALASDPSTLSRIMAASFRAAINAADAAAASTLTGTEKATRALGHPAAYAVSAAADANLVYGASTNISDVTLLETGGDPVHLDLWSDSVQERFLKGERVMLELWDGDPPERWAFWRRWWEGAKTGQPLDPELQLAIVKGIDDETWKDPDAVAKAIAKIEEEFGSAPEEVDRSLQALPASSSADVQSTRHAMIAHREDLPSTLDNILGYISLEIDRLQSRNYRDAEDAAEAQRQIRVLTTIHVALSRLETLVPDGADMPEADAEQAEKLTRLVFRRFREWPRAKPGEFEDNTADLADSAYRAAMVGGFAYLAPMVGAAPDKALIAGAVVFGGKKIIDSVKAAKDAFGPDK